MTGSTIVDDSRVVEVGVGERRWRMTGRAVLACGYVRRVHLRVFAGCVRAVMARATVRYDACMIKRRRGEAASRNVADVTVLGRWHMIRRSVFASGICTVVARVAATVQYLWGAMVDESVREVRRVVASRAVLRSVVVQWRRCLAHGAKRGVVAAAIVAAGAVV